MTTDFRALCAELSDALRNAIRVVYHEDGTQHISTAMPILRRARAALADEPAVPEGREPASVTGQPSDGEVAEFIDMLNDRAARLRAIGFNQTASQIERAAELLQHLSPPQPVPVSERLPGDQLCWWLEPDEEDEAYGSSWTLLRIRGGTSSYTHWLPAHALPLPGQEVEG